MALKFSKPQTTTNTNIQPAPTNTSVTVPQAEEVQEFNIVEKRNEIETELLNSPEIEALTAEIDVSDPQTIVAFGGNVADEIAKASDAVLNNVNMKQLNDTGELLGTLAKIMDKFDIDEIKDDGPKGFFGKLFNNAKKQLEAIISKYNTMGDEVEKINVQLRQYENEIIQSNKKLKSMFEANVVTYQELVKYIVAGEKGLQEIDEYLVQMNQEFEQTGDGSIQITINSLENAKIMLEQRVHDLKIAENIAMQSVPMINTMQFSNLNLIRKINSAFIITLPVFKQALAQAVLLKRQKIQAEAMQALDEKTNEMILKNAKNTVAQSKLTAQLSGNSSVKIETLEESWRTIVNGIEETKQIQEDAKKKRAEDSARLEAMKADYKAKMGTTL
ncbi:MAG: toxic anion resistance protein [Clostridium sp.]